MNSCNYETLLGLLHLTFQRGTTLLPLNSTLVSIVPLFIYITIDYLQKTYLKTASLISKSCLASTLLSTNPTPYERQVAAFTFGRYLGLAFQLVDDMLDFTSSSTLFGKGVEVDLKLGLATAPVLYASLEYPQLDALIKRRFSHQGDVEAAREWVDKSQGVRLTRDLARVYCTAAVRELEMNFAPSEHRDVLVQLTNSLLERNK